MLIRCTDYDVCFTNGTARETIGGVNLEITGSFTTEIEATYRCGENLVSEVITRLPHGFTGTDIRVARGQILAWFENRTREKFPG